MNNLKGPWYSLTETQQKLEITATELNYLITEEELLPVVFTKSRNFLLFYPEQEGWAGLAACQYRGHLALHRECIAKLLDGDKVGLGKAT